MPTVKGFIRSYGAAVRRAEREQQRKTKEAAKRYKEQLKREEIADAQQAVKTYNEYIEMIQSIHVHCTEGINWDRIKESPPPEEPKNQLFYEAEAQEKLNQYRPSILDKIFNSSVRKLNQLESLVEEGKRKDKKIFALAKKEYLKDFEDWEFIQQIAQGLDKGKPESYKDALQYFNPFSDIGELGTRIELSISDHQTDIDLHINSEEIIPDYELKQTARGILSKKSISKSRFNELYQDYICSCVIRVARELFAYLPIQNARINAIGNVLNTATGYLEERPILSVIMVPSTINSLNLNTIDPSDSMQNFIHNMKFSKTKGFTPVEKIELK